MARAWRLPLKRAVRHVPGQSVLPFPGAFRTKRRSSSRIDRIGRPLGVDRKRQKFRARGYVPRGRRMVHLGYYRSEQAAARAVRLWLHERATAAREGRPPDPRAVRVLAGAGARQSA